jgi:hypothetical protein
MKLSFSMGTETKGRYWVWKKERTTAKFTKMTFLLVFLFCAPLPATKIKQQAAFFFYGVGGSATSLRHSTFTSIYPHRLPSTPRRMPSFLCLVDEVLSGLVTS